MDRNSLENLLKNSGFKKESDGQYTKVLENSYSVVAFINGQGVIFHLRKDNNDIVMTIQADNYDDIVSAFEQLMSVMIWIAQH